MRRFALFFLAGCAASASVPVTRFANQPAVRVVNDRREVAKQPEERIYERYLKNFDGSFYNLVVRKLEDKRHLRAQAVNALDEVPDSTWFTNRIGVRNVSPEEILDPPGSVGSPEKYRPWTVESTKVGGLSIGFIIKDTRGEKFLLKFDRRGLPEAETGTQLIIGRLLWALGYNVTDDYICYIKKSDLKLAPDAKIKAPSGKPIPLDQVEFDKRMSTVEAAEDGTMRALLSHYLEGKPLGGHSSSGVRADDPNDRVPHELRRDLRGTYAIFEWLDHNDLHEGNSLDMYVTDPKDKNRHYVKHYFVDFGIALGVGAVKNHNPRYSYEYQLDWSEIARSLFSFGLIQRPWEDRKRPPLKGVGAYDIAEFDPGAWKPATPMYTPVHIADRWDKFWGSKLIMKLTREHIRAAVQSARLSDPRAETWLVDALIARQRKVAKYWFERVNPLDEFTVDDKQVCFKDLSIVYAFTSPEQNQHTRYTLTFHDRGGKAFRSTRIAAGGSGVSCGPLSLAAGSEGYTIVRIDTRRPGFQGTTYVYVARDPKTAAPRVIGIWRV
jgi:hypothetical protein